ncbi:MAG TPA: response regulator [Thermoanaerobaculia bacterium]|nr:response regulator [Thermoanaerobaculia bacterium]
MTTPSSVLRFDLAIQRNHLFVYTIGFLSALVGMALGVFPLRLSAAIAIYAGSCASALVLSFLFRRGVDRRWLNPVWMAVDVASVTVGIYASGGAGTPWFIWYLACATAAAFAIGRTAAYAVSVASILSYLGVLLFLGQATLFNDVMLLAATRMIFLFGASFYFLIGVADLQEKRMRIKQLEEQERAELHELTRVTQELADANRRIQEANNLKSQFLANMSHELRTPMNSIIGFSEILVERLQGKVEPKHLGFLRHIHTSGTHLLGIINDVLDLSKVEAGKMEIYPEFFSVAPVIESVCQVMRGMTRTQQKIVVDVPADLPQIETDLAKFKQILFNLVSNAVKFSPADQPIVVNANVDDGTLQVTVRDEGIGIAPHHHGMIWEEFRQVDGTVRREFGGTGLGLALVKKFVELQGGRVAVDSSLGSGSTFTFTLPVRSHAAVVTRTPETVTKAPRVLVVEDDGNAYELIASALGSAGFLPIRARHGDEALRMARDARPAAVTLDVVLPGMDGWEVLRRLKSDDSTRALPVVIISMMDNRDLGVALGADDYFVKPVDRARLLQRLREITSRNGARRLLIIDDDAAVHSLLGEELTPLGYALDNALSGEDGLRAAQERAPDVIILDLMMPGMSGFEVAGALKANARTANIPILVLTSKEISTADRALLHPKVSSVVQKGASTREQLVREIRRVTAPPPVSS